KLTSRHNISKEVCNTWCSTQVVNTCRVENSKPNVTRVIEPMSGRRGRLLLQRRRIAHEFPLSAHAAHVHGAANGGPVSYHRHSGANTVGSRWLPMGHVPAQS